MRRIPRLTTFVLCLVSVAEAEPGQQVRHVGMSSSDSRQLCVSRVLGKPVVLSDLDPLLSDAIKCPASRAEILEALPRDLGLAVYESDDWVYLIPIGLMVGRDPLVKWTRFEIRAVLGNLAQTAITTRLRDADLHKILGLIRAGARMVPDTVSFLTEADGKTGVGEIVLDASIVRVASGRELLVGVFRGPNGPGRLFVGARAQAGENASIDWDSRLFDTSELGIGFEDVDADGVLDILVRSACCSLRPSGEALTIFTTAGEELTRQDECELNGMRVGMESAACPIVGDHLKLEKGPGSTQAIVGYPLNADPDARPFRYVLTDGRFRLNSNAK